MRENKGAVYAAVGFLGLVAVFLGFLAEAKHVKESDISETLVRCYYAKTRAIVLGFTASLFILLGQITISFAIRGAFCWRKNSDPLLIAVIIQFVFSWMVSLTGIALLLAASIRSTRLQSTSGTGHCNVVKEGIFSGGAGLAATPTMLNIFAYRSWLKYNQQSGSSPHAPHNNHQSGVAMG